MKAMILAAGRGERMRPLTDTCPKPLLAVGGRPLIEWHIRALAAAGIDEIVINHAWLGEVLEAALGDGSRLGVRIAWSREYALGLETAGGIAKALPLLGAEPFLVVNGDVYCQPDYHALQRIAATLRPDGDLAHLLVVPNPEHHPQGDFVLDARRLVPEGPARLTFSGIGAYHPALFADVTPGTRAPLGPLLRAAIARGVVGASRWDGLWRDIGTPERLAELDRLLQSGAERGTIA